MSTHIVQFTDFFFIFLYILYNFKGASILIYIWLHFYDSLLLKFYTTKKKWVRAVQGWGLLWYNMYVNKGGSRMVGTQTNVCQVDVKKTDVFAN